MAGQQKAWEKQGPLPPGAVDALSTFRAASPNLHPCFQRPGKTPHRRSAQGQRTVSLGCFNRKGNIFKFKIGGKAFTLRTPGIFIFFLTFFKGQLCSRQTEEPSESGCVGLLGPLEVVPQTGGLSDRNVTAPSSGGRTPEGKACADLVPPESSCGQFSGDPRHSWPLHVSPQFLPLCLQDVLPVCCHIGLEPPLQCYLLIKCIDKTPMAE